jgi:hypothetical protein
VSSADNDSPRLHPHAEHLTSNSTRPDPGPGRLYTAVRPCVGAGDAVMADVASPTRYDLCVPSDERGRPRVDARIIVNPPGVSGDFLA